MTYISLVSLRVPRTKVWGAVNYCVAGTALTVFYTYESEDQDFGTQGLHSLDYQVSVRSCLWKLAVFIGSGLEENFGTAEVPVDDGNRGLVVDVVESTGHVNCNGDDVLERETMFSVGVTSVNQCSEAGGN